MKEIYDFSAFKCSRIITKQYSTSFSLGIKTFHPKYRFPIYGIYGFARYADEIVDTFHDFNKSYLLNSFRKDLNTALEIGISMNPIIHAFQQVVKKYNIDYELIDSFLKSMEMDLTGTYFNKGEYDKYIFGSAEVVGLMCLKVFCEGDERKFNELKQPAMKLGSAFQKVNFLRDIKSDYEERGRTYFPGINFSNFTIEDKRLIEKDIAEDFSEAYEGIKKLPRGARAGVYLAYRYYLALFKKIKACPASQIMNNRVRVPGNHKLMILLQTYFSHRFILK